METDGDDIHQIGLGGLGFHAGAIEHTMCDNLSVKLERNGAQMELLRAVDLTHTKQNIDRGQGTRIAIRKAGNCQT